MTSANTPASIRLLTVAYVQFFSASLALIVLCVQVFVVIPRLAEVTDRAKADRETEIRHMKVIEDTRRRQSVWEAGLLVNQKENLRVADEMSKTLKGLK